MNTENIQKFLMPPDEGGAYTDEKLAALLAHAQDGKLAFNSCCCLIGIPTAGHALKSAGEFSHDADYTCHSAVARKRWRKAEEEFQALSEHRTDAERRENLIPLILAEMERREKRAEPDPRDEEGSDVRPELEIYKGR